MFGADRRAPGAVAAQLHAGHFGHDLRGIVAPTLVVWGEEDKFLDPKLPERLVNAIPDARDLGEYKAVLARL